MRLQRPLHRFINRVRFPSLERISIWVTTFTKVVFFLHFVSEYVGEPCATAGPSMLPTIAVKHDCVWVNKSYRRGKEIMVGDLVNIKHPMFPGEGAIKRILGMPGDFVVRDTPDGTGGETMIQVWDGDGDTNMWALQGAN